MDGDWVCVAGFAVKASFGVRGGEARGSAVGGDGCENSSGDW